MTTFDLERAARAACDAYYGGGGIEERALENAVEDFVPVVAAVLRELREPSEAMRKAGWDQNDFNPLSGDVVVHTWASMIDAIHGEPHDD